MKSFSTFEAKALCQKLVTTNLTLPPPFNLLLTLPPPRCLVAQFFLLPTICSLYSTPPCRTNPLHTIWLLFSSLKPPGQSIPPPAIYPLYSIPSNHLLILFLPLQPSTHSSLSLKTICSFYPSSSNHLLALFLPLQLSAHSIPPSPTVYSVILSLQPSTPSFLFLQPSTRSIPPPPSICWLYPPFNHLLAVSLPLQPSAHSIPPRPTIYSFYPSPQLSARSISPPPTIYNSSPPPNNLLTLSLPLQPSAYSFPLLQSSVPAPLQQTTFSVYPLVPSY